MDNPLTIYNTLTNQKEVFIPLDPKNVRMYVCGMTVYDYCHVGHARVMVVFDVVYRWLKVLGYPVTYVRNITDIDDTIIHRALERNQSIFALTEEFTLYMNEDAKALNILSPDHEPRATAYIPQMQTMIGQLTSKGFAYTSQTGDVNFAVRQCCHYGALSGRNIDDLRAGERVSINEDKRDPLDFVLWKKAKAGEPAEAIWQSPWGAGRPGWHIECSAMSTDLLGHQFDIHGGGADLQFPHHENEIAQSECALGLDQHDQGQWVNYWMHNGFVRINDEKMSKSLGNFFTIRQVLSHFTGDVVRLFILRAHYRSPLNYSQENLAEAQNALLRLYAPLKNFDLPVDFQINWQDPYPSRFLAAMNDDFNTPQAFAVLFELANKINKSQESGLYAQLYYLLKCLGLLSKPALDFFQDTQINANIILQMIQERQEAKKAKNFARADQIRAELFEQGIVLEDVAGGNTEWRKV